MKKIILIVIVILYSCSSTKKVNLKLKDENVVQKRECNCIEDLKKDYGFTSRKAIVTNLKIVKNKGKTYLQGNCADVIRLYLSDGGESESVQCISQKNIEIEINDSTEFKMYVSGPKGMSNEEGRKYFFEELIHIKKAVFLIEIERENDVALMIQRNKYLEKTK